MIFETDHRASEATLAGISIISGNLGQTFNILKDPSSWGQPETPRVVNSTDQSRIVFSFEGIYQIDSVTTNTIHFLTALPITGEVVLRSVYQEEQPHVELEDVATSEIKRE